MMRTRLQTSIIGIAAGFVLWIAVRCDLLAAVDPIAPRLPLSSVPVEVIGSFSTIRTVGSLRDGESGWIDQNWVDFENKSISKDTIIHSERFNAGDVEIERKGDDYIIRIPKNTYRSYSV